MDDFLIGDTVKLTWVNSGVTADDTLYSLINEDQTVVNTGTLVDSGNGHYYAYVTLPDSQGFYVAETLVTVSSYPFKRRVKLRAVTNEV